MLTNMLTNSYVVALVIPLLLLSCGAIAKKLVRGGGWKTTDFFLGIELALAAVGSAMVYFHDILKLPPSVPGTNNTVDGKIIATASFLAISFFLLLWMLSTHQDWEGRTTNQRGQIIWLGILTNLVGIALFASFIILVKGV